MNAKADRGRGELDKMDARPNPLRLDRTRPCMPYSMTTPCINHVSPPNTDIP